MAGVSFRRFYKNALLRRMSHPTALSTRSALVFAPHQDDETLGCGGMMIQKRRNNVPVWIAFLTDGSRSHQRLMDKEDIKAMRMREACAAGQVMGVPEENIRFLQFPNGALDQFRAEAQQQVETLLQAVKPEEVYIPSAWDFHSEHRVTAEIVLAALRHLKMEGRLVTLPDVYEYPVWFWYQWPWVGLGSVAPKERLDVIKRTLRYGFGWVLLTQFRRAVAVGDVLALKREALNQHVSQMTRPTDNPSWPTLGDMAGGEFLDCFFHDYEVFRKVAL